MPEQATIERARRDARKGKSPSTQAGEFVREQIHHIRAGMHGAKSEKQAIAIGLSEARRAGVPLPPSRSAPADIRKKAEADLQKGREGARPSRARALRKERMSAAPGKSLSRKATTSAPERSPLACAGSSRRAAATRQRAAA
jgi:hypothetical protein